MKEFKPTKKQQMKLDFYSRVGEIIDKWFSETGYLNFVVKISPRSKPPYYREICVGKMGGTHLEKKYERYDTEFNIGEGLYWEWSRIRGGVVFQRTI